MRTTTAKYRIQYTSYMVVVSPKKERTVSQTDAEQRYSTPFSPRVSEARILLEFLTVLYPSQRTRIGTFRLENPFEPVRIYYQGRCFSRCARYGQDTSFFIHIDRNILPLSSKFGKVSWEG